MLAQTSHKAAIAVTLSPTVEPDNAAQADCACIFQHQVIATLKSLAKDCNIKANQRAECSKTRSYPDVPAQ
jgi:hypothetical protein